MKLSDQSKETMNSLNEEDFKANNSCLKMISLGPKNLNDCLELDQVALSSLWNKMQWEKELSEPSRITLGSLKSSKLIGFGCCWVILDEAHLTSIAVHPKHRKKGIAKKILSSLLEKAQSRGATKATLEVSSTNTAAIRLYKSLGFETKGIRKHYYKNGNDALIQWKCLIK